MTLDELPDLSESHFPGCNLRRMIPIPEFCYEDISRTQTRD